MRLLLDTNIIVRMAEPGTASCATVLNALANIDARGFEPCIVPQVLYEYWVVCTRPATQNGLGFTVAQTDADIARLQELFVFLRDERAIFEYWNRLVTIFSVSGRNAHDARLVAAMQRHGLSHILTFNQPDFARYPHITVLVPDDLV